MKRRDTGSYGELLARDFLKRKHYSILETNFRCRAGEIDIVAFYQDVLVFVEVRSKTSTYFGSPEESITYNKREHLKAAAGFYLQKHGKDVDSWRIDVVAVELGIDHKLKRIEHIENAIEE
jgi:putative endonuclease